VTVTCITAASYVKSCAREAGAVAKIAVIHKTAKSLNATGLYICPHGPVNEDARHLTSVDVSRRLLATTARSCFRFSVFLLLLLCNESTQFCCTTNSVHVSLSLKESIKREKRLLKKLLLGKKSHKTRSTVAP